MIEGLPEGIEILRYGSPQLPEDEYLVGTDGGFTPNCGGVGLVARAAEGYVIVYDVERGQYRVRRISAQRVLVEIVPVSIGDGVRIIAMLRAEFGYLVKSVALVDVE